MTARGQLRQPEDDDLRGRRPGYSRYDKLAITCRAAAVLSGCITWTRHIGDVP